MSLGSLNKRSKCVGSILAYEKNKPGLITILYIKSGNEESFIGFKVNSCDVLSTF